MLDDDDDDDVEEKGGQRTADKEHPTSAMNRPNILISGLSLHTTADHRTRTNYWVGLAVHLARFDPSYMAPEHDTGDSTCMSHQKRRWKTTHIGNKRDRVTVPVSP